MSRFPYAEAWFADTLIPKLGPIDPILLPTVRAHVRDFVNDMPTGYQTYFGHRLPGTPNPEITAVDLASMLISVDFNALRSRESGGQQPVVIDRTTGFAFEGREGPLALVTNTTAEGILDHVVTSEVFGWRYSLVMYKFSSYPTWATRLMVKLIEDTAGPGVQWIHVHRFYESMLCIIRPANHNVVTDMVSFAKQRDADYWDSILKVYNLAAERLVAGPQDALLVDLRIRMEKADFVFSTAPCFWEIGPDRRLFWVGWCDADAWFVAGTCSPEGRIEGSVY